MYVYSCRRVCQTYASRCLDFWSKPVSWLSLVHWWDRGLFWMTWFRCNDIIYREIVKIGWTWVAAAVHLGVFCERVGQRSAWTSTEIEQLTCNSRHLISSVFTLSSPGDRKEKKKRTICAAAALWSWGVSIDSCHNELTRGVTIISEFLLTHGPSGW